MTVTTTLDEQLATAHYMEASQRWAQAAHAYDMAIGLGENGRLGALDLETLRHLKAEAVARSHESVSITMVPPTEAAKAEFDRRGAVIARLLANARGGG